MWREAYNKVRGLEADVDQGPGRPKQDDEASAMLTAAKREASELKHSFYALVKAPEHLTDNQKIELKMLLLTLSVTELPAFVVIHLLDFVSLRHCSMAGALGPGLCIFTSGKIYLDNSPQPSVADKIR